MYQKNATIIPFLTFLENAEEAVNFYTSIFPNSKITSITKIGKDDRGEEGKILNASFDLKGNQFMAMDIGNADAPEFTWGISLFVSCEDSDEFDLIFDKLSENGLVIMGPEPIYNLRKAAWVTDKFGVTWQLVWA